MKLLSKVAITAIIIIVFTTALLLGYYSIDLPDVKTIYNIDKQPSITIYDKDNKILAVYGDLYGKNLKYNEIPQILINAVIAIEDRRFFSHSGVDYISIIRAAYMNRKANRIVQGGSTITQQLAKISFLDSKRTFKRKIQELLLSINLEKTFSKQEILRIYLNRVYLGRGNFGIDAATKYYFGKDIKQISLYESAILAAMLKAPNKYAPTNHISASINRARQVLNSMKEEGYINEQDVISAIPPVIITRGDARGALHDPYFSDYVMELVYKLLGDIHDDIKVYTTLDLNLQKHLSNVIKSNVTSAQKRNAKEIAAVVMDKNGQIKAMVGGSDYEHSQFNRAVNARRQPGSAFKLFVYLSALQSGYKPNSIVVDSPININKWSPKNFSREYLGEVTLEEAFARSINTVAVKLSENVGRQKIIDVAHRLGIKEELKNLPSIALGTEVTSLIDMVTAYTVISNNGYLVKPVTIKMIINKDNKLLYKYKPIPPTRLIKPEIISDMKQMLRAVINYGTAKSVNNSNYNIWGKTGTTQNYKDAWFIGFDSTLTAGVWVGNDDNKSMNKVSGGGVPLKIWKKFMDSTSMNDNEVIILNKQKNNQTINSLIERSMR